jgi:hypothetical protein
MIEIGQWREAAEMHYQPKISLDVAETSIDTGSRAPVKPSVTNDL